MTDDDCDDEDEDAITRAKHAGENGAGDEAVTELASLLSGASPPPMTSLNLGGSEGISSAGWQLLAEVIVTHAMIIVIIINIITINIITIIIITITVHHA